MKKLIAVLAFVGVLGTSTVAADATTRSVITCHQIVEHNLSVWVCTHS